MKELTISEETMIKYLLELKVNMWIKTEELEQIGIDMTDYIHNIGETFSGDVDSVLNSILNVGQEYLSSFLLDCASDGIIDGSDIWDRLSEEIEVLENGGTVITSSEGRTLVRE